MLATLGEYIRDLIRHDRQEWAIVSGVMQGLKEVRKGSFVEESILDILEEE